jgi:hypothetical protein
MIGPAWTYNSSLPKPAGTQNMGTWTKAVYTEEQLKTMTTEQKTLVFGSPKPAAKLVTGASGSSKFV